MHQASHARTHARLALSTATPASISWVAAPMSSPSPVTAPAVSPVAGQHVKGIYWSIWLNGYDLTQRHRTTIRFCRNIVMTVNLDCRLDLKTIALHARNAKYNPKVCPFNCQTFTVVDPTYSISLLSSCAFGIRRPQRSYSPQARWSSLEPSLKMTRDWPRRSMRASYKNSAFDAKFFKFKIQNIVGSSDVKFLIR